MITKKVRYCFEVDKEDVLALDYLFENLDPDTSSKLEDMYGVTFLWDLRISISALSKNIQNEEEENNDLPPKFIDELRKTLKQDRSLATPFKFDQEE